MSTSQGVVEVLCGWEDNCWSGAGHRTNHVSQIWRYIHLWLNDLRNGDKHFTCTLVNSMTPITFLNFIFS